MWLCVPAYWGSLWKFNKYTDKLTVRVIDRDDAEIGQTFSRGLLSQINLNFFATDSSELPTAAEVAHDVVEEGVWASMPFYLLGEMVTLAGVALLSSRFSRRKPDRKLSAATYLQDNANDVTAFRFVAQAPSTITNAVWYSMDNLRPYDHPVAQAITLVGLMLMPIFSFIMTMTNNAVREVIAPFLTTRAYIIYRLVSPVCLYLPVSFFFCMVNLPFKVHFGAHFIYAGDFFLWWFSLFLVWPLWPRYRVTNYRARFQVYGFLPSAHYYRECLRRQLAP
ncbi:endoplasmic reticulum protein [Cryptococcus neoformans c45]|nr:endoplasmic reticulum protein [Cryptococcus neoformans var. grubii c45]